MKPGYLTLPTIWRGCAWPAVRLQWLNQDGAPINLSGWIPRAFTRHFDLNARIVDPDQGITTVSMNRGQTADVAQGVEDWDWVWMQSPLLPSGAVLPPMLKGKVLVRHPITNPEALTLKRIGGGSNYVATRVQGPHFSVFGRYDLYKDLIRDQITEMRGNGQNQIAFLNWFVTGLTWPHPENPPPAKVPPNYANRPWVFAHAVIPWHAVNPYPFPPSPDKVITDATLSPQSEQNLKDLLSLLNELEFDEVHMRIGGMQGHAGDPNDDPVPVNDDWASAILLTGTSGTIEGHTVGGSRESRIRQWNFASSITMADPGAGLLRLNNVQMSNATQIAISQTSSAGFTQHDVLVSLHTGDKITLHDVTNQGATTHTDITYKLTGNPVNNTTWFQLPVTKVGTSHGGTPAANDLLTVSFVVGGRSNTAEIEPAGGGESTVWYKINGNNHWWSFQVSRPFRSVIEAFHGPGVYHLTSDGISNGSLNPPMPCTFYAATGTVYYIRVGLSNVKLPFEGQPNELFNMPDYFNLAWKQDAGSNEPAIPDYPVQPFPPNGWDDGMEAQFVENSSFIRNLAALVEANKGALNVNYSIMGEGANRALYYSHTHRYYLSRLWREWTNQFGSVTCCAAGSLPSGYGISWMIDLFNSQNLPLPGFYAIDPYAQEIEGLTRVYNTLKRNGEQRKKIYIMETFYNDPQSAKDVRTVLRQTGLNFGGIIQWTKVRSTAKTFPFPDGFPKKFNEYFGI